jgi:hypothetical protein
MDSLGLPVMHGQFAGDARELECRSVGCCEGEVVTSFRLYSAENISRTPAFVFVVAPCFASWHGGRGRADVGVQRDRFLVQAHHRFGWILWTLIRFQHVFHLGDVLIIEFAHAPHFFPATA